MRELFQLAFLALVASTFTGCFDGRPVSRLDSGPVVPPPTDSGPITLTDSGPGCAPESTASACTDFADNDCDGQIDCNDISCCSAVSCATGTLCGNMGVDAGRDAGRDAGPTSCPGVSFPSTLPAACLPRCSSSTLSAWGACPSGDSVCVEEAFDRDTTPTVTTTVSGEARVLDCFGCVAYQQNTCAYTSCTDEYIAYAECGGTATLCPSEAAAFEACLDASTAFSDCASREVGRCFP